MSVPNRFGSKHVKFLLDDCMTALIAFRMGRATEEHFYELTAKLMIAETAVNMVQRHKHLLPILRNALRTLDAIASRQAHRVAQDAYWAATAEELDSIDLAYEVAKAVILATPGPTIRRAILRVRNATDTALEQLR